MKKLNLSSSPQRVRPQEDPLHYARGAECTQLTVRTPTSPRRSHNCENVFPRSSTYHPLRHSLTCLYRIACRKIHSFHQTGLIETRSCIARRDGRPMCRSRCAARKCVVSRYIAAPRGSPRSLPWGAAVISPGGSTTTTTSTGDGGDNNDGNLS